MMIVLFCLYVIICYMSNTADQLHLRN